MLGEAALDLAQGKVDVAAQSVDTRKGQQALVLGGHLLSQLQLFERFVIAVAHAQARDQTHTQVKLQIDTRGTWRHAGEGGQPLP